MTKILLSLLIIALMLGGAIWYTITDTDTDTQAVVDQTITDFNIQTTTNLTPTSDTVFVQTKSGKTTPVRNFKMDSDVATWYDETTYLIGSGANAESDLYQIFFFGADASIVISLLSEPLRDLRLVAEHQLLKRLGVTESEACELSIRVSTPSFVSEEYSGRELGLSFCPNSLPL